MATTIYTLSNVSATLSGSNVTITGQLVSNVAWTAPASRQRIREGVNPNYARQIQVSSDGMLVYRPGIIFGIRVADIMAIAYKCVPGLSWPPVITAQPISRSVTHPAATTFAVTATVESGALTYQWQISSDNGQTWGNVSNGGVYSTATTATLNISNSTGLNGKQYRCNVTVTLSGATQVTASNAATLNVA